VPRLRQSLLQRLEGEGSSKFICQRNERVGERLGIVRNARKATAAEAAGRA